jgi:hypothetical protein
LVERSDIPELHALDLAGVRLERHLHTVRDRRRVLPSPARLFLDFLGTVQQP